MGWQTLLYTYTQILTNYNKTNTLQNTITIKPWKYITDPNARSFTNQQVIDAAIQLKTYIETNHQLPDNLIVNGTQVSIYTFLYLLTTAVQNIHNENNSPIDSASFTSPQIVRDVIHPGDIPLSEYIKIADQVKVYMDCIGVTPGYASQTSLGPYLSYRSMIYMYAQIMSSYNSNKVLPHSVAEKPWALVLNPNALSSLPVYIVSDSIDTVTADTSRVNIICDILRTWGLTTYNYGLGSNYHCTVLMDSSVPQNALVVNIFGGACAGTLYEMGGNWYKSVKGNRDVFTIFMCGGIYSRVITGLSWLPRSSQDNFSPSGFTGLANPDQYLLNNGYRYYEVEHGSTYLDTNAINAMATAIYEEALLYGFN